MVESGGGPEESLPIVVLIPNEEGNSRLIQVLLGSLGTSLGVAHLADSEESASMEFHQKLPAGGRHFHCLSVGGYST